MAWKSYKEFTPEQKAKSDVLVRRGEVRHLLTPKQRDLLDLIEKKSIKKLGYFASRRSGKTWGMLLISFGLCLKYPRLVLKFVLDTQVQARDVVLPIIRDLKDVIPVEVFPEVKKADGEIHFKNGSVIKLGASNKDHADKLRGTKCDIVICDEAAFFDPSNWEHVLYSLLMPQMLHSEWGQFVFTTTPPDKIDHPFVQHEMPIIERSGGLIKSDIYENVFLTPDKIQEVIASYRKGKDDLNFKREHELALIAAQDLRVVPEFIEEEHVYKGDALAPFKSETGQFTDMVGYVFFDHGLADNTVILVGLLDWRKSILYIVRETVLSGKNECYLSVFAAALREAQEYAALHSGEVITSGDCFESFRISLAKDHGIVASVPAKHNLEGGVGVFRSAIDDGKIQIHESCKQLIAELNYALWKASDSDIKKIERTSLTSHADATFAAIYMVRRVNWTRRPGSNNSLALKPRR
jgi:hypothetical protein